ncbi:UvrD-helicase domain-containing protein [Pseudonocardia sp. CA-142604]|uniref:UvrD-helicase domain-containing protein n=1 Tax=Pseudonocardia sp. CA-142604 TaxID=3240024 RepID=UPI003D91E179
MYMDPSTWKPSGIEFLEPAALTAVRLTASACITAGPGAGKTEFLAQRAAFLLQTGICPAPRKILAISFKRDAARNLGERVRLRCAPAESRRFISLTFDAFAKSIVDRFGVCLPEEWRPARNYSIHSWDRRVYGPFLDALGTTELVEEESPNPLDASTFEANHLGTNRIPIDGDILTPSAHAALAWWQEVYLSRPEQRLSFTMINRLAEATQRLNPEVGSAIRATFPYVFVDEFQDTTYAQFDLLHSIFGQSDACITAVGDDKQRIMVWAGARTDAFDEFKSTFGARSYPLRYNWRSSPALVAIQEVVARTLEPKHAEVQSQAIAEIDSDHAQVWLFSSKPAEAEYIASWLVKDMRARGTSPKDYAILVRQTANRFEEDLYAAFTQRGLKLRNENRKVGGVAQQDLMSSQLSAAFLPLFRLITLGRQPMSWVKAVDTLCELRDVEDGDVEKSRKVQQEISSFARAWYEKLRQYRPNPDRGRALAGAILDFLNPDCLRKAYQEYSGVGTLDLYWNALVEYMGTCTTGTKTWAGAVAAYQGDGTIPILTVHKSKGLEYDTVVLIGLDDSTWWSHTPESTEGTCTFFVALSRAKQRAMFTYCGSRGGSDRVADLYGLLRDGGVPVLDLQ